MKRGEAYGIFKGIIEQNLHRSIKYALAGFVGFLMVEFMTYVLFHLAGLQNLVAVIPAFLTGVAVEFSVDELWTTRHQGVHTAGISAYLYRMGKFETLNLAGTSLAVFIQYLLFILFTLTPLIGNIVGAACAFPINYYIQMRSTWKIRIL